LRFVVLVYDGDCSFCSSCARWLASRWRGSQRAVAWQHLSSEELAQLGLTESDVRSFAWWIDESGHRSRGHLAIARALGSAPGWPSYAGRILLVAPVRWLAAGVYSLVARWRHRLPGVSPACRL
jgi:predicted DCC family thiol-disulfide oxidoreductase YuxK